MMMTCVSRKHCKILEEIKSWLPSIFKIKDMDETDCVLGVWNIIRNRSNEILDLSQDDFIHKILKQFECIILNL